jgi:TetR/AcrR family transcriptional regulator, transcriptional repressor for nem operon
MLRGVFAPKVGALLRDYKRSDAAVRAGQTPRRPQARLFLIFSTIFGAVQIGRMIPDPLVREAMLSAVRDFLLDSF